MNPKTIRIQGKGRASQAPDSVRISFTLTGRNLESTQAVKQCHAELHAIRAAAERCGLAAGQLKTTHFIVREENNEYSTRRKPHEFEAMHILSVVLPLDKEFLTRFLAAVNSGPAHPEVSVEFEVADAEGLQQRALADAVENARRSAENIAKTSGIKLSRIAYIEYGKFQEADSRRDYGPSGRSAGGTPDFAAGFDPDDIRTEDTVAVTWEIEA